MQSQPYERRGAADSQRLRAPVPDGTSQVRPPVGYAQRPAEAYRPAAAPYGEADFARGAQAAQGQPMWQPSGAYAPPTGDAWPSSHPAPMSDPVWQSGYTGPVDPFDEPGVDPKLKRQRSAKVYSRKDPFWDAPDAARPSDKPRSHAGSHVGRKVLVSLAVLLVVGVVLYGMVFRVRTIEVEGNAQISDEEIIALSGVNLGASIARVDVAKAKAGINNHCYLVFQELERQLPNRVIIRVKERSAAAVMYYCGYNYTIDAQGMVLEETADLTDTGGLTQVSGMDISDQYGCKVGYPLRVSNQARLVALKEIMVELKVLSAQSEVTMIKLSDLSHILLETREGYSVSLGDTSEIHAKLKAMLAIKEELNKMGKGPGTIDVGSPEEPTFLPEVE